MEGMQIDQLPTKPIVEGQNDILLMVFIKDAAKWCTMHHIAPRFYFYYVTCSVSKDPETTKTLNTQLILVEIFSSWHVILYIKI